VVSLGVVRYEALVGRGADLKRLLQKPIEQESSGAGTSTVEAERELV
jgi:hypothetical protein